MADKKRSKPRRRRRKDRTPGPGASDTTRIVIASLVAASAILGALTAWRAGKDSIRADEADRAGFRHAIDGFTARADTRLTRERAMYGYLRWVSLDRHAAALADAAGRADPADAARLRLEARAEQAAARSAWFDIPPDARGPKPGQLMLARAERTAFVKIQAAKKLQVDPQEEFADANRLRRKAQRLVLCGAFMIVAAVAFTLGQMRRQHDWRFWVPVGIVIVIVSGALAIGELGA